MSHKAGSSRRRHGGGHEEEHENHERWLVSYADMMTLLMVLFIVLFAISQVDQQKFEALRDGLAAGFGATTLTDGGPALLNEVGADAAQVTIDPQIPTSPGQTGAAAKKAIREAVAAADRARAAARAKAAEAEVAKFEKLQKQITEALKDSRTAAGVRFRVDERGLVVTIVTSSVVFGGDSAVLRDQGRRIIDAIGPVLRATPNSLEVDGHTNQLPVPTRAYPSAWELSTARASAVARYLIDEVGVASSRLSAAGFAGERPLYPPTDPRAPSLNRRVEIVVLSTLPPAERALLPAASGH